MVDNQHKQIDGYRDFGHQEIDLINQCKAVEKQVASLWLTLRRDQRIDQRELAIARTEMENGFMRMVRSIAQPKSPYEG